MTINTTPERGVKWTNMYSGASFTMWVRLTQGAIRAYYVLHIFHFTLKSVIIKI